MLTLFSCNTKIETITTTETVEILNNYKAETLFYFENNWKVLREKAIIKDYILNFDIVETEFSETNPYHIKLVTIYKNKAQYDEREAHFQELIKESGPLKLLNDKKPAEFRKSVSSFTEPKQN
ncbi:hypothetical protein GCM10011444_03690 [Winogradskyella haliclonae]|uniref:Uncharacterized protein n=2 Tax=Winogradskyella haliclonae TaxID=2048558 RepID=A0ABQ2BW44_9FLAO|nr:hypothetical protein GCM10011444_03690 [Winogradskyella haliclonae]